MKNLINYFVIGVLDLCLFLLCSKYMVISVIEIDYIGVLLWSFIFAIDLSRFLDRQRNFVKYYPNFEDTWNSF